MSENAHIDFSHLTMPRGRAQCRAEETFAAAEGALDLPSLAIRFAREAPAHQSPVFCARPFVSRASAFWRNGAFGADLLADEHVEFFDIVFGVKEDVFHGRSSGGRAYEFFCLDSVAPRSQRDLRRDEEMGGALAESGELRPAASHMTFPAAHRIVVGDVAALKPRGVAGDQPSGRHTQPLRHRIRYEGVKQAVNAVFFTIRTSAFWRAV